MRYPSSCTVSRKFWVSDCQGSSTEKSCAPNIIVRLCVSPQEKALFEEKASTYQGNISSMIRDAVKQFDDTATVGKIKVLTEAMKFFRKYQQDLSWMGGNFNQQVKRANELAITGELSQSYFDNVLLPETKQVYELIQKMKDELEPIASMALKML